MLCARCSLAVRVIPEIHPIRAALAFKCSGARNSKVSVFRLDDDRVTPNVGRSAGRVNSRLEFLTKPRRAES